MDRERPGFWGTGHQRGTAQSSQGEIELVGVHDDRTQPWPRVGRSCHQQFFRDCLRVQEGAEAQEVGRCRMRVLNVCYRETQGRGHRIRVGSCVQTPAGQHVLALLGEPLDILAYPTAGFIDIGPRLIQSEWQACQHVDEFPGCLCRSR